MDNAVLLVDDEENILNALARLFLDRDVRVLRAGNGEEALGIVRREPVAVVVSDNLMPGMRLSFPDDDPYFVFIEEMDTGRSGRPFSADGNRDFVRKFIVMVKDNKIGPSTVCSCPGVPIPWRLKFKYRLR